MREIITQGLLMTMGSCLLSVGHFGETEAARAALSSSRSRIKSKDRDRGPVVADNVVSY